MPGTCRLNQVLLQQPNHVVSRNDPIRFTQHKIELSHSKHIFITLGLLPFSRVKSSRAHHDAKNSATVGVPGTGKSVGSPFRKVSLPADVTQLGVVLVVGESSETGQQSHRQEWQESAARPRPWRRRTQPTWPLGSDSDRRMRSATTVGRRRASAAGGGAPRR